MPTRNDASALRPADCLLSRRMPPPLCRCAISGISFIFHARGQILSSLMEVYLFSTNIEYLFILLTFQVERPIIYYVKFMPISNRTIAAFFTARYLSAALAASPAEYFQMARPSADWAFNRMPCTILRLYFAHLFDASNSPWIIFTPHFMPTRKPNWRFDFNDKWRTGRLETLHINTADIQASSVSNRFTNSHY